ncbi:transcriptional regulator [Archaeoglobus fulgidus]|uniref:transcriptional regulator n=1 Tax=Archaeoglobus fulgidus TaxID=2234 RepID=UPI000B34F345|nr:transcriptional regulator [Archaeoglobus fulgidus]
MSNPLGELVKALEKLSFKPSDVRIYSLLLERGGMRVSEIARELDLSARFVRDRLKVLLKRGFVRREIVEKGWVGYIYSAEKPEKVLKEFKSSILGEIERIGKMFTD